MSTRCMIGVEMGDSTIKAIYCHYDGYPEGVGKTLQKHYADPDKAARLVEMGDLSVLGSWHDKKLAEMCWHRFDKEHDDTFRKKLDLLTEDMTIDYKSRGETGVDARTYESVKAYLAEMADTWCDYFYLFTTDHSGVYRWHYAPVPYFKPLELEDE